MSKYIIGNKEIEMTQLPRFGWMVCIECNIVFNPITTDCDCFPKDSIMHKRLGYSYTELDTTQRERLKK